MNSETIRLETCKYCLSYETEMKRIELNFCFSKEFKFYVIVKIGEGGVQGKWTLKGLFWVIEGF